MSKSSSDVLSPKKRPPLFWWFLANTLAIAFAITSWIVCLTLFRDPTQPTSYKLMMQVGRIDPLARFSLEDAPSPQVVSGPREIEARYESFSPIDLETLNRELRRAYLTNFKKAPFLTYLTGEFQVVSSRLLDEDDFLSPGIAIKAQALIRPDAVAAPLPYPVFIECLLPGDEAQVENFPSGYSFTLEKSPHCAAVINVGTTLYENREVVFATAVPLATISFETANGTGFQISPPKKANPAGNLPALP